MAKILILNQATVDPSYTIIDYLSRHTWTLNSHPDVRTIHYYGGYDNNDNPISKFPLVPKGETQLIDDNILVCGINDTLGNYFDPRGEKMIMAIEYCLKHFEWDFMLRICNTSYIHIPILHRVLSETRKERIYDGTRNLHNNEISFVTGFNSYMSRDTAEVLIQNKHLYLESKYLEDLALGDVIFHQLKYTSFEDQPHHHTHVWAFEDNFQPDHWIQNTDVFNYRFRSHTPEKLIKFHEHIMNKYDTKN
jgi:hypothetical protein